MVNKHIIRSLISVMAIFIVMVSLLTACGGKPASTPSPSPATPPPAVTPTPKVDPAALKAKGEEIYQRTAGGVGCKSGPGTDGKGIPNTAPDVREASADDIKRALGGDAMNFVRMTDEEIQAVAAYLQSLK